MKKLVRHTMPFVLVVVFVQLLGCATLRDPVVQHCAGQTLVGGVLGGVAATTLANSKASRAAAAAIGGAGGAAAGFFVCRQAFMQAQALQQRITALESQLELERRRAEEDRIARDNLAQTVVDGPADGELPSDDERFVETLEVIDNRAVRLDLNSSLMFASGDASLRSAAYPHLDVLAESLRENPRSEVTIIGHTDNVGSAQTNRRLSGQRAEAVMSYLSSKGVDRSRLHVQGVGPDEPIADNRTEEGRAKNRRVEIVIVPVA